MTEYDVMVPSTIEHKMAKRLGVSVDDFRDYCSFLADSLNAGPQPLMSQDIAIFLALGLPERI